MVRTDRKKKEKNGRERKLVDAPSLGFYVPHQKEQLEDTYVVDELNGDSGRGRWLGTRVGPGDGQLTAGNNERRRIR